MGRKWLKIAGWSVGALVLLMVLTAVLVPLLVPREQLRQLAEERAREATGGDVDLGPLSVSVFPRLRLVLGESSVAVTAAGLRGVGQEPGALDHGNASLQRLEVDLALWPLLRRNLEFGEVKVVAPQVELTTVPRAVDDVVESGAEGRDQAATPAAGAGGVGLALATIAVEDGALTWREAGTGRGVTVTGWQQELTAPDLGHLMTRLQRLGGADLPADDLDAEAILQLDARVATVVVAGDQPLPELADLRLRAELALPRAADRARLQVHELSLAGLSLEATGGWDATRIVVDRLALSVGEAGVLAGRASLPVPPLDGPATVNLSGPLDLPRLLALVEPWLPPATLERPLPQVTGTVTVDVEADLVAVPALDDMAAWMAAWEEGLDGRVEARASAGRLGIAWPGMPEPLAMESCAVVADLASPRGRTRVAVSGLDHPAAKGDLSLEVTLPPSAGPLLMKADLSGDLAAAMTAIAPLLPPRPDDASPLPRLDGRLTLAVDIDLPAAPALDDSSAWAAAWDRGLAGRAELTARGGPLTIAAVELGDPVAIERLRLDADLRGRASASELILEGIAHEVLRGDAALTVVPLGAAGVPALRLTLDELDLDALIAVNEARKEAAAGQQVRRWTPVRQAWAEAPAVPVGEMIPMDLALDAHAEAGTVRLARTPYRQVRLDGTLRERVIDVPGLEARLGTGRITGSARVDYAADPTGHASWQGQVSEVPASALLEPYAGWLAAAWSGALDAEVEGSCALADPEVLRRTLTLIGDIRGTDGAVDLRQQLSGVTRYLGSRQDLLHVGYDRIGQHIAVDDGKVMLRDLRVDGKQTDWSGGGWVSLDGAIDVDLHVKLPAGFTPDLGDLSFLAEGLRDDQGRIGLDLTLSGPSRSPVVALDLDPAAVLEHEDVRKRLQEEAQKGLGGLLDRLKGR